MWFGGLCPFTAGYVIVTIPFNLIVKRQYVMSKLKHLEKQSYLYCTYQESQFSFSSAILCCTKKPLVYHDSLDNEKCCLLLLMQGQTYFFIMQGRFKQHRRDNSKFVQLTHEELQILASFLFWYWMISLLKIIEQHLVP